MTRPMKSPRPVKGAGASHYTTAFDGLQPVLGERRREMPPPSALDLWRREI